MGAGTRAVSRGGRSVAHGQVASSQGFDWQMALLPGWVLIGLYVDGWAHVHIASALETFFTPWHAFLYMGMFACLVALVVALLRNHEAGYAWRTALPAGYELSLGGALLFGIAGGLDMGWHLLFGIEVSTEALLSPTHLLLAISGFLLMSGPLRAYQLRAEAPRGWRAWLPLMLSLLWVLSLITFFTQFAHPARTAWAASSEQVSPERYGWIMGVDGFLVQAFVLASVVLFALRRWPGLPTGAITLLVTVNAALMCALNDEFRFIPAGLVTGILGDLGLLWLRGRPEAILRIRLFAFGLPAVASLTYFIALMATGGTWWRIHLVAGSVLISGLAGWLISYLVFPDTRAPA